MFPHQTSRVSICHHFHLTHNTTKSSELHFRYTFFFSSSGHQLGRSFMNISKARMRQRLAEVNIKKHSFHLKLFILDTKVVFSLHKHLGEFVDTTFISGVTDLFHNSSLIV